MKSRIEVGKRGHASTIAISLRTDPIYLGFQRPRTIRIGSHTATHHHRAGRKKPVEKHVIVHHAIPLRWLRSYPRSRPTA